MVTATKAQHTPGPLEASATYEMPGHSPYGRNWLVNIGSQTTHAPIGIAEGATEEEAQANARLFAAAPDLLEACKVAFDLGHIPADSLVGRCLLNAIAKAEGQ